ncbi:hypothetical protein D9M71_604280 [compost metagenome]
MGLAGGDRRHAGVDLRQPGLHMALQQLAAVGEDDAAMHAVEQAHAEQLLQALDLLAHGRLGGAQLAGRAGEAEQTGGRVEHPQQFQRRVQHVASHKLALSEACLAMRFTLDRCGKKLDNRTIP